jgi:hypothetical protein
MQYTLLILMMIDGIGSAVRVVCVLVIFRPNVSCQNLILVEVVPIDMSLDENAVHAGHKVLLEVYDNISLIVGDPWGF